MAKYGQNTPRLYQGHAGNCFGGLQSPASRGTCIRICTKLPLRYSLNSLELVLNSVSVASTERRISTKAAEIPKAVGHYQTSISPTSPGAVYCVRGRVLETGRGRSTQMATRNRGNTWISPTANDAAWRLVHIWQSVSDISRCRLCLDREATSGRPL